MFLCCSHNKLSLSLQPHHVSLLTPRPRLRSPLRHVTCEDPDEGSEALLQPQGSRYTNRLCLWPLSGVVKLKRTLVFQMQTRSVFTVLVIDKSRDFTFAAPTSPVVQSRGPTGESDTRLFVVWIFPLSTPPFAKDGGFKTRKHWPFPLM